MIATSLGSTNIKTPAVESALWARYLSFLNSGGVFARRRFDAALPLSSHKASSIPREQTWRYVSS